MKTSDLPIIIKIEADVIEGYLQICVANTGQWFIHPKNTSIHSTNTGIMNIKSRLGYSFPNNHEITTKEENGWVKVTIKFYKDFKNENQV